MQTLDERAVESVNTPTKLKARFKRAIAVLRREYKAHFTAPGELDFERKAYKSADHAYILVWQPNGTSIGGVELFRQSAHPSRKD